MSYDDDFNDAMAEYWSEYEAQRERDELAIAEALHDRELDDDRTQ